MIVKLSISNIFDRTRFTNNRYSPKIFRLSHLWRYIRFRFSIESCSKLWKITWYLFDVFEDRIIGNIRFDLIYWLKLNSIFSDFLLNLMMKRTLSFYLDLPQPPLLLLLNQLNHLVGLVIWHFTFKFIVICYLGVIHLWIYVLYIFLCLL